MKPVKVLAKFLPQGAYNTLFTYDDSVYLCVLMTAESPTTSCPTSSVCSKSPVKRKSRILVPCLTNSFCLCDTIMINTESKELNF